MEATQLLQQRDINVSDPRAHVAILIGVWALVYPYIAYVIYPRPWDEIQFYAPTAKRMAVHGQWLIPHLAPGEPFLEKPPLALWVQGLSMELLGPSLFAARLPSTVFGLASALLVYHIGRSLDYWRSGLTAGLLFLATPLISIHNHSATTADLDIYLLFFGSAFVWLVWQRYDQRKWMALAGIAGAGAALTKGLGVVLFCFTLAPIVAWSWRRYFSKVTVVGICTGLAVLLPWLVYAYLRYPDRLVQSMFLRQFRRSRGAFGSQTDYFGMLLGRRSLRQDLGQTLTSPGSFGQQVADFSLPILFFIGAAGLLWRYRSGTIRVDRDVVLAWWVLSVPLFFTIAGGNHDWYILPVVVPLVVLASLTIDRLWETLAERLGKPFKSDSLYVASATIAVLALYGLWYLLSSAPATGPSML